MWIFGKIERVIAIALLLFPWISIAPPYQFTEHLTGIGDWILRGELDDPADALMAGKPAPRTWLLLHEPGEGRLADIGNGDDVRQSVEICFRTMRTRSLTMASRSSSSSLALPRTSVESYV